MKNLILNIHHLISLHHPQRIRHSLRRGGGGRCPIVIALTLISGWVGQLQALVIRGDVTDGATGKPLTETSVTVAGTGYGAAADSAGRFIITGIPPGEWTVSASRLGYAIGTQKVAGNADTAAVHFKLQPQAIPMKEVVFTATRTLQLLQDVPVATELVRGDEIRNRAALTAADALQAEIGLDVQDDFSGQGVTIQGVDPDKVLVLVDGNRVIGRVNGSIDLDQIATGSIKQIEVVKGAVSTLYGSEAIGGVINIISQPANAPFEISADLNGGGWAPNKEPGLQTANWSSGAALGMHRGKLGVRISSRFNRTGLVDTDPNTLHTDGADAADRLNIDLRLDRQLGDDDRLTFSGRFMDEAKFWVEGDQRPQFSDYLAYDDLEDNTSAGLSLEWERSLRENLSAVKVYRTSNSHDWRKRTQKIWGLPTVLDYSRAEEGYTELSALATRRLNPHHLLTGGLDFYVWDINARSKFGTSEESFFSSQQDVGDAYFQEEWTPLSGWILLPGLRYERHEIYGDNWSPRLSVMWTPWESIKVRGSAGLGYRAPSAKELYYDFNHVSAGYIVYGNPNLTPEQSENYTFSLEHRYHDNSVGRVSFFYNNLQDLITFEQISPSTPTYPLGIYQYNNIFSAWTAGVELERSFRMGRGLETRLSYIYLETFNRQTGNRLIQQPKHSGRWTLTWQDHHCNATLCGRYTGRRTFADIAQTPAQDSDIWAESYQIWNVSLSRDLGSEFEAYVKVENLFDANHPRHGPRLGRVATVGVRWLHLKE
jgi:outer membrane receptor for ferrienterochelin and colicins